MNNEFSFPDSKGKKDREKNEAKKERERKIKWIKAKRKRERDKKWGRNKIKNY